MTKKRFKLFVGKNYGVQKADGEVIFDSIVSIGDADVLVDLLNDLTEENEQLKSVIKEVTELLSDEVDLFSDKATEHDIIAYVELKELDNKDAYYMATATKKAIRMLKELQE